MDKQNVYIDFEAISPPFIYKLGMRRDLPFMYTIGIFNKDNIFVTKTHLINLKEKPNSKINSYVFKIFRKTIINDLYTLLGSDSLEINAETIRFIAWDNYLEEQLLHEMFGKYEISDLARGNHISLDLITKSLMDPKEYFSNFTKDVKKNIDNKFYNRRGLNSSGALASIAGYLLYSDANQIKNKYYFETNIEKLRKEVIEYSKDDVIKMGLIVSQGNKWFMNLTQSILKTRKLKNKFLKKITINNKLIKFVNKTNVNLKINDYINQLNCELDYYETCTGFQTNCVHKNCNNCNSETLTMFKEEMVNINNMFEFINMDKTKNIKFLDDLKNTLIESTKKLIKTRDEL